MKKKELINWLCLSGIICFIFYLSHDIIGGLNYPGYSWAKQACSDLTAVDSPSFIIANSLSNIYGILSVLCCSLVSIIIIKVPVKKIRIGVYLFTLMSYVSAIGYSLFPLSAGGYAGTFQDIIHLYLITVLVVLLSIISLILITIGGLKNIKYKKLGLLALFTLLLMMFGAIGSGIVSANYFGIVERFSTYSAVIFIAILGIYGFKNFE